MDTKEREAFVRGFVEAGMRRADISTILDMTAKVGDELERLILNATKALGCVMGPDAQSSGAVFIAQYLAAKLELSTSAVIQHMASIGEVRVCRGLGYDDSNKYDDSNSSFKGH